MLGYLNHGPRDYHSRGVHATARGMWEFQAVVAGRCGPFTTRPEDAKLRSRWLWVFAPGTVHGWTSEPGKPCRIVVAHFDTVPSALRDAGTLERPLSKGDARRVERIVTALDSDYLQPTRLSPIRYDRAMLELTLIALADRDERPDAYAAQKTRQALAWFVEQMDSRPTVESVAEAVGVSSAHLRRLFRDSGAATPLQEFKRLQLDRAKQLLGTTTLGVSQVAEASGFGSASDFSRTFARHVGRAPAAWRQWELGRRGRRRGGD